MFRGQRVVQADDRETESIGKVAVADVLPRGRAQVEAPLWICMCTPATAPLAGAWMRTGTLRPPSRRTSTKAGGSAEAGAAAAARTARNSSQLPGPRPATRCE